MGVECIEYGSGQFALYGVIHEYGVTGYPTLFLLDPEGTIRFVKIGYSPLLAEELELAVRQILHDRPIQAQKNK